MGDDEALDQLIMRNDDDDDDDDDDDYDDDDGYHITWLYSSANP